jgi:hypothetical protein
MSEFSPNKKFKSDDDFKSNDVFEHKANSSQHNLIFGHWLINKFGSSHLRSKNGVIDVAGIIIIFIILWGFSTTIIIIIIIII